MILKIWIELYSQEIPLQIWEVPIQSEKDYLTMSAEDMSESSKICFAHGTLKRYFALPTPESAETPHGTCLQDGTETL